MKIRTTKFFVNILFSPILLTVCLIFAFGQAHTSPSDSNKIAKAKELIDLTELKVINNLYKSLVDVQINARLRAPACAKDPACKERYNQVRNQLMASEAAEVSKAKEQLAQIISNRYSSEQLDWLLKMHKYPLYADLNQFINSKQSSGPSDNLMLLIKSKLNEAESRASTPTRKK